MTKLSQSAAKDRITIGKVGAAHGIHGEMRIIPLTDFIERFASMKSVMVDDELLHIEQVRYDKQYILMKFREYSVREDAMCLTNKLLTVARSEAAPLAEGEFYAFDIIGLSVTDTRGVCLGQIDNILRTGSNDVYVVHDKDNREHLIPALKAVVKNIDLEAGTMLVEMPEEA